MSKAKFLYIDDENDSSVEAIRDGFNDQGLIEVVVEQPQDFKTQKKLLLEKIQDFDGLILDLRLDGNMQLDVSYNAPAIAQEFRTIVPSPCPIILCSTDEIMRATYDVDKTSHDLFDYKFLKGSNPNWPKISKKLLALAEGYNSLKSKKWSIDEILGREDIYSLDSRIFEVLIDNERTPQIYDISSFIIKDLLHHSGPLIKEQILAARLGVDIIASGEAWNSLLKQLFEEAKYSGMFSDGWNRWWADKINIAFKEISGGIRLTSLNAAERVKKLVEFSRLKDLKAAEPLPYCNSSNFWTICEGHKKPLDPIEGFRVFESSDLKPWQEAKYISFDAEVNRIGKERGLRIHPSEKDRITSIKASISEK